MKTLSAEEKFNLADKWLKRLKGLSKESLDDALIVSVIGDAINEAEVYWAIKNECLLNPDLLHSLKQVKSGEMFQCEGRTYIIKTVPNVTDACNLENGQNIFTIGEI